MRKGERFAAQTRIGREPLRTQRLDIDLALSVPQLAEEEVDLAPIRLLPAGPAE